jgi:hypothetical protein
MRYIGVEDKNNSISKYICIQIYSRKFIENLYLNKSDKIDSTMKILCMHVVLVFYLEDNEL